MNADALRKLLRQTPFMPFELILSSGDRIPVFHPEMMMLMKERVLVATPPNSSGELPDDYVWVSYLHIAAARPLEASRSSGRA